MMTADELRALFPTQQDLPPGWKLDAWWSASRGTEMSGARRVYLNANGTDDELRFLVFPPGDLWRSKRDLWPDCDTCHGTGRVLRPQHSRSPLLDALLPAGADYDAADAEGLRRCYALNCEGGRVQPLYGASNAFIRVPGFPEDLLSKTGARGMSSPTQGEILRVMHWCDGMLNEIKRRPYGARYP